MALKFVGLETKIIDFGTKIINRLGQIGACAFGIAMLTLPNIYALDNKDLAQKKDGRTEEDKEEFSERVFFVRNGYPSRDVYFTAPDFMTVTKYDTPGLDERDICFSADGSTAVFTSGWRAYVGDASWKDPQPITREGMVVAHTAVSPSGTQVAFSRGGEVYVVNKDGTGLRKVTVKEEKIGGDGEPCWNPVGDKIVFTRTTSLETNIYIVRSDGTDNPTQLTWSLDARHPAWDPTGEWIAFVADQINEETKRDVLGNPLQDKSGKQIKERIRTPDVFMTGTRRGGWRQLTDSWADLRSWYIGKLSWSPKGDKLVLEAHPKNESFERLYVIDVNKRDITKNLKDTGIIGMSPVWTYIPKSALEKAK